MSKKVRVPEDLPTTVAPRQGSFIVYDWMAVCLGLSMLPLLVFALIFSVTIGGDGSWHGSTQTMAKRLGVTSRALIRVLRELVDTGMIIKYESPSGRSHKYTVSQEIMTWYNDVVKNVRTGCEYSSHPPVNDLQAPCEKTSHNNGVIVDHVDNRTHIESTTPLRVYADEEEGQSAESSMNLEHHPAKEQNRARGAKERKSCAKKKERPGPAAEVDFMQRIIDTYPDVGQELAEQFVSICDKKGANKTESAWRDVVIAVEKAKKMRRTPAEFFHFMVYRGWYICNAKYVFDGLAIAQPEELRDMTIEEAVNAFDAPQARDSNGGADKTASRTSQQNKSVNEIWHRH